MECKACHSEGAGKYCSRCGQALEIDKITAGYWLREMFYFFTYLDRGIGYTLKELVRHPGRMQREYLEGNRIRHQKPFAMYFLCATVLALVLYWVNTVMITRYHAGVAGEIPFFNKYMVLMLVLLIPVSTLITYMIFYPSGWGFAEVGVLQLYTMSVVFLLVLLIQFLKFVWPTMETRYLELPAIMVYSLITYTNFFNKQPRWIALLKAAASTVLFYLIATSLQDWIVRNYM